MRERHKQCRGISEPLHRFGLVIGILHIFSFGIILELRFSQISTGDGSSTIPTFDISATTDGNVTSCSSLDLAELPHDHSIVWMYEEVSYRFRNLRIQVVGRNINCFDNQDCGYQKSVVLVSEYGTGNRFQPIRRPIYTCKSLGEEDFAAAAGAERTCVYECSCGEGNTCRTVWFGFGKGSVTSGTQIEICDIGTHGVV